MKRMLVNVNDPEERRIAIVEDGQLQELHVELADRESYLGNIYKGKVVNIEPSIGAAFINFGGNKNGFLHASDVVPGYGDDSVELLDILEGRARISEDADGPDSVRQVLADADGEDEDGDGEAAPRKKRRGRRGRKADKGEGEELAADEDEDAAADSDADAEEDSDAEDESSLDAEASLDEEDGESSSDEELDSDEDFDDDDAAVLDEVDEDEIDDDDDDDVEDDDDVDADDEPSDDSDDGDDDSDSDSDDDSDDEDPSPRRRRRRGPSASAAAGPDEPGEEGESGSSALASDDEQASEDKDDDDAESGDGRRRRRRRRRRKEPELNDVLSSDDEAEEAAPSDEASEGDDEQGEAEVEELGRTRTRGRRGRRRRKGRDGDEGDGAEAKAQKDGEKAPKDEASRSKRGAKKKATRSEGRKGRSKVPIADLLKKGQEVVVQITKEGIGAKGPTLTTYLSLPGRSLVLMPSLPKCGVSRKIEDERERRRLKRIVRDLDSTGSGGIGFIVRTAGVGKSGQDLERDLEYLSKLWGVVVQRAKATRPPAPLYVESDLVLRTMRDLFSPDIDEVVIDNEGVYKRVRDFVEKLMPRFVDRIKHHEGIAPLFHSYGLEESVEQLYQSQVDLKHGSSIVIEQTEALVAIDVNSGRYKPGANLEETAYRTNLEAIPEIVRQLKLRDLGGVIIVDFIDMQQERHRRSVERKFREALKGDRARINVGRISIFGTLELTRQRVGPGLKKTVFKTCPLCKGTSLVRTVASKSLSILRAARALARLPGYERLEIYANPDVCEFLNNRKRRDLSELEDQLSRLVLLRPEPSYPIDVVHYRFLSADGREAKVNIPAGLGVHA